MSRSDGWLKSHRTNIICGDAAVIIFAVLVAQFIIVDVDLTIGLVWPTADFAWLIGLVVALVWLLTLAVEGVWQSWALKNSKVERRRILLASLTVFAGVGIIGYLTTADPARTFLLIVAPLGIAGLLINHWLWRRRFAAFRRSAAHQHGVLVLGDLASAGALCHELREGLDSRFEVNGVWMLRDKEAGAGAGAARRAAGRDPNASLTARPDTAEAVAGSGAVAVVAGSSTCPDQQTAPALSGHQLTAKRIMDLSVAVTGLVLLSPLLIAAAVMVLLADGGPVLHQQECVGRRGKEFKRWTFRCTPYGAKARPASVDASSGGALRVEYELATTSIGRLLRRTGLACAPGLFNVLAGQMSVVGPNPMAPGDVTGHPVTARPGLTGRWRLLGHSDETAGTDVQDEQEWSAGGDMRIIGRSLKLAVTGKLPC